MNLKVWEVLNNLPLYHNASAPNSLQKRLTRKCEEPPYINQIFDLLLLAQFHSFFKILKNKQSILKYITIACTFLRLQFARTHLGFHQTFSTPQPCYTTLKAKVKSIWACCWDPFNMTQHSYMNTWEARQPKGNQGNGIRA